MNLTTKWKVYLVSVVYYFSFIQVYIYFWIRDIDVSLCETLLLRELWKGLCWNFYCPRNEYCWRTSLIYKLDSNLSWLHNFNDRPLESKGPNGDLPITYGLIDFPLAWATWRNLGGFRRPKSGRRLMLEGYVLKWFPGWRWWWVMTGRLPKNNL